LEFYEIPKAVIGLPIAAIMEKKATPVLLIAAMTELFATLVKLRAKFVLLYSCIALLLPG
jgi:hypothetical protein